jgi:hypothetical protein
LFIVFLLYDCFLYVKVKKVNICIQLTNIICFYVYIIGRHVYVSGLCKTLFSLLMIYSHININENPDKNVKVIEVQKVNFKLCSSITSPMKTYSLYDSLTFLQSTNWKYTSFPPKMMLAPMSRANIRKTSQDSQNSPSLRRAVAYSLTYFSLFLITHVESDSLYNHWQFRWIVVFLGFCDFFDKTSIMVNLVLLSPAIMCRRFRAQELQ